MKVLVTRTDRLGDLVLSLPVFGWLKSVRPDWIVHAMVAPGAVPLVEHHPGIDGVWTWTGSESPAEAADLEDRLRAEGFDALCASLLAPAARTLGEMWDHDRIAFADVMNAAARIIALVRKHWRGDRDQRLLEQKGNI